MHVSIYLFLSFLFIHDMNNAAKYESDGRPRVASPRICKKQGSNRSLGSTAQSGADLLFSSPPISIVSSSFINALHSSLMNCFGLANTFPPSRLHQGRFLQKRKTVNTSLSERRARSAPSQERNIDKMSASHLIILPRVAVGKIAHAGGSSGNAVGGLSGLPCVCSAQRHKPIFADFAAPTLFCCNLQL